MRVLFGANIRKTRLKAEMTQTDVEGLYRRQHYASEIEHGRQNQTLDMMATLATVLSAERRSLLRYPPKRG